MTEVVAGAPLFFGLAAEAPGDASMAAHLADRVICDAIDWLDEFHLGYRRRWGGLDGPGDEPDFEPEGELSEARTVGFYDLHSSRKDVRERSAHRFGRGARIAFGHFEGQPGAPDAQQFTRVFDLFARLDPQPAALVVMRDLDKVKERRLGFEQALRRSDWPFVIVGGSAHPEGEAWLLAGFVPADDEERTRLMAQRQALGFWPHEEPHRLTASGCGKADCKRVFRAVSAQDPTVVARCLAAPLDRLAARGEGCGLRSYLDAVRTHLAPLCR